VVPVALGDALAVSAPLETVLATEELRRREFPITRSRTYIAHAAVGPLPRAVVAAVQAYVERASHEGPFEYLHERAESEARRLAADLIGASPAEIAFVPSTSAGLSTVAAGLEWRSGDRVLIREGDFPANVYPWLALRERGVEVDRIPGCHGVVTPQVVLAHLTPRTRLVSLSSIDYLAGTPVALDEIGSALRARDVLFCVDAIQSLGVVPTSVKHVDFLAADAHKWLLGPQGMGILYVSADRMAVLRPPLRGWRSVENARRFTELDQPLASSARRYEPGGINAMGVVALHAALELLGSYGHAEIAARVVTLRARIAEGLLALGRAPLGECGREVASGIVSFGGDPQEIRGLHRRLDERRIVTSLRVDGTGSPCIRIAPHFYTSDGDVDRLLEAIGEASEESLSSRRARLRAP
jgi:selenocysteine lyase/cysteine desulfurase